MLLLMYAISAGTRVALGAGHAFWTLLLLLVGNEAASSPVAIIANTAVTAVCDSHEVRCGPRARA